MFGGLVQANRKRLGLSQEDLAARTGLSVRAIGKLETGKIATPRPVTLRLLADAFGLVGGERERFLGASTTGAPAIGRPGPRQLPADPGGFAGRVRQRAELDALFAGAGAAARADAVIVVLSGMAGVGKTALAVHWAHRIADRFPGGQLYVDLRGFGPEGTPMDPAEVIRRFLDALDTPTDRIPTDRQAQAALYRSRLAGRRMLLLLDNVRDTAQVRPLLPGAPGCLILITSRNQLTGLVATEAAHPLVLDVLTDGEARELLARRIGADRVASEAEAAADVIGRCARLPLALALVAARAATHPRFPLTALAGELDDAGGRLDALAGDDPYTNLRIVFSWSHQALTAPAARLFRLLGLHPGADIAAPTAASLAGIPLRSARRLLAELTRSSLLTEHRPGRYTLHDLVRAYVADLVGTAEPERERATRRLLDHYVHTTNHAHRVLYDDDVAILRDPPEPGVIPERFADHQHALRWFIDEHPHALALIDHAAASGFDTHALHLASALYHFLFWQGRRHDAAAVGRSAVTAARRSAGPAAQARAHRMLAAAYIGLDRDEEAHAHQRQALDLYRRAGDPAGEARVRSGLAYHSWRQGNPAQALDHARHSIELHRAAGNQAGLARALADTGWYHAVLGEHRQALAECRQGLALLHDLGDRHGEAAAWDSLGYIHHHLGQPAEAAACYRRALALARELGSQYLEASILIHLGDTHRVDEPRAAHRAWQHALTILTNLEHPDADQVRTRLAGLDPTAPDHGA